MRKFILPFIMAIMFVFIIAMPVSAEEYSFIDVRDGILNDLKASSEIKALKTTLNYQTILATPIYSNVGECISYHLVMSDMPMTYSNGFYYYSGKSVTCQIQYKTSMSIGGGTYVSGATPHISTSGGSFNADFTIFNVKFAPIGSTYNIKIKDSDDVFFSKTEYSNYPKEVSKILPQRMTADLSVLLPIGLVVFGLILAIWLIPSVIRRFL